LGKFLSPISCEKKPVLTLMMGAVLTDPEKVGNECLDFEDALDYLRLRADAIRVTLS